MTELSSKDLLIEELFNKQFTRRVDNKNPEQQIFDLLINHIVKSCDKIEEELIQEKKKKPIAEEYLKEDGLLDILKKRIDAGNYTDAFHRECLIKIYENLPVFPIDQTDDNVSQADKEALPNAVPELKKKIAEKALCGWDQKVNENINRQFYENYVKPEINEDAEKCFIFFCKALRVASNAKDKFRDDLLKIFRDHLAKSQWRSYDLKHWVGFRKNDYTIPDIINKTLGNAINNKSFIERKLVEDCEFYKLFPFHELPGDVVATGRTMLMKIMLLHKVTNAVIKKMSKTSGNVLYCGNAIDSIRAVISYDCNAQIVVQLKSGDKSDNELISEIDNLIWLNLNAESKKENVDFSQEIEIIFE